MKMVQETAVQAIHYFDHFVVDGTVFNGYYYHDETGKFKASEHILQPFHRKHSRKQKMELWKQDGLRGFMW